MTTWTTPRVNGVERPGSKFTKGAQIFSRVQKLRLKAKIIVTLTSAVIRKPTAHLNTVFILLFPPNTGRKSQNKQITGTMNSSRAAFSQESGCPLLAIRKNAAAPSLWSQRVCEHTAHPQVYTHQVKVVILVLPSDLHSLSTLIRNPKNTELRPSSPTQGRDN